MFLCETIIKDLSLYKQYLFFTKPKISRCRVTFHVKTKFTIDNQAERKQQ